MPYFVSQRKADLSQRVLLNLGCGQTRPEGWINTDSSLNSLLQSFPIIGSFFRTHSTTKYLSNAYFMDLNRPWSKFKSDTIDVVYASHVFEHLSLTNAQIFLDEAYRVLKSCGVIRIIVPDLYQIAKRYVVSYEKEVSDSSNEFLYAINLHKEGAYSNQNYLIGLLNLIQGYPHQHKYMYDYYSLSQNILRSGFSDPKFSTYGKSSYIPEILEVESTSEGVPSLYVEALKN